MIINALVKNTASPYENDYSYFPKSEMIKIKQNNYNYFSNFKKEDEDNINKELTTSKQKNDDARSLKPSSGYLKEKGYIVNGQHFSNDYVKNDFYDTIIGYDKGNSINQLNKRMNRIRTEFDYPSVWNYHDIFTKKNIKDENMNLISNLDPNLAFREDPFRLKFEEKMKSLNEIRDRDVKSLSIMLPIEVKKPMAPIKTFKINKYDENILLNRNREHETIKNLEKINKDFIQINYKNIL